MHAGAKPPAFRGIELEDKNANRFDDRKPWPPTSSRPGVGYAERLAPIDDPESYGAVGRRRRSENVIRDPDRVTTMKPLDANRYATKKTIAQGMLDIALLTANASQLKYILQVGRQHEFYTLMLTLICVSIGLQALVGILFIIVGGLDINRRRDHRAADLINDAILIGVFLISLTNVVISGFGMEFSGKPPEYLSTRRDAAEQLLQGIVCIVLGSTLDINKTRQQSKANVWNNASLVLMMLIVAVNVVASAFEMRESDLVHRRTDDSLRASAIR